MNNHMKQPFFSVIICLLSFILAAASPCSAESNDVELHGRIVDIMAQPRREPGIGRVEFDLFALEPLPIPDE